MTPLADIIADEIRKQGVISFARFMELALYCPVCGYYEKEADTPGRRGDFFTSVSVGSLFGELLAFQFADWLTHMQPQPPADTSGNHRWSIVEAGAHDGRLAEDILTWLRERRPELFAEIEYCIVEPSARRREWQQRRLERHRPRVRWCEGLDSLGGEGGRSGSKLETRNSNQTIDGIIFSNELLDAFPVHRLGWDAAVKDWFEWGVTLEENRFAWVRLPQSAICNLQSAIQNPPAELLAVLPDGFTIEVSPAAEQWWRQAAGVLRRGKLLAFDYGLAADEFFAPGRSRGTARAYRRHQAGDNLLADPGDQDLTAHVNFTAIQQAGEAAGLATESFATQAAILTRIAERAWRTPADFGEWTPARTRQFQTLTHPEHLGRAFRVLIQAR